MGSTPKTKGDYMKKIAYHRAEIAKLRGYKAAAPRSGGRGMNSPKIWYDQQIANHRAKIARLQAEMYNAPR